MLRLLWLLPRGLSPPSTFSTVTGAFLGLLTLALLSATGILVGAMLGLRSAAELALAAYVAGFAEVVGFFLLLSLFDAVTRGALIAGLAAIFVAVMAVWVLLGSRSLPPLPRLAYPRAGNRGPVLVLAVAVALGLGYVIALIVGTPPNGWDPLNYHLARSAFWLQSGGVGYIHDAYDQRLNFNPPNGEIGFAFVLGVTREENFVGFVQLFAALACAVGVFAFARRLGLRGIEAAFGALLFLSLPLVLLQSSGAKNDIIVASFLLAAAVFFVGDKRRDVALGSLATALAVGTKFTAAYGLAVLVAVAVAAPPRSARASRVAGLALGAALGSYWYFVNAHETGLFLGDQSNVPGLTAGLHARENLLTAYGVLTDLVDLSGARGADIFLYAIAALVLAVGLTLLRSRRIAWRATLLATALSASPLVLLVATKKLGHPGLVRLYDVLGKPQAYLALGDETASSPTTASDTASWYGPAGLLLLVGTPIASVRLVRRRSLPTLAGIAALAPLGWFALVALSLTYNPWLGRFFVLPIALSGTLWGLALRARSTAWASAALATVTVSLALVHYAEKPSGLRLLDRGATTASVWSMERWQVQSQHDPAIGPVFRFLDHDVPAKSSVALALSANDFGYPAFGPHLERHVELVPFGSNAENVRTEWLVTSNERASEIDASCWQPLFRSDEGAVFRRRKSCAG
jgi:hypothetical protein